MLDIIEHMSQSELFSNITSARARPIIKWAGGKNRLLSQITRFLPPNGYKRYFEPFLGGAAMFFALQPAHSFLFDINSELIELYQIIRDKPDELIDALKVHRNEKEYYYQIRSQKSSELTPVKRAARFIFLNKTCYNGLYRVNQQGGFNVPFGKYKNPTICDEKGLRAASLALQNACIQVEDFETVTQFAEEKDLIYFDPPYEPLSATSNFTSYTSSGFTSGDQHRVAEVFHTLSQKGCYVMLSNSSAPLIYDLYRRYTINEINARRAINSDPNGRGIITELLITNY